MAIMILIERGVAALNDKIKIYFSDAPGEWDNMTIFHLLTHTSGMGAYPLDFNYRLDYTDDELYILIKTFPIAFSPGERYFYSDIGYVMLGILIGRLTNQSYGDFLKENILNPSLMKTARIISESDIIPNRAAGYLLIDNELKNQDWVAPTLNKLGDGSLYLTMLDMIQWDAVLYDKTLLKQQSSFDAMWSRARLNNGTTIRYGFGWFIYEAKNGLKVVWHAGEWQGFQSIFIRIPEARTAIVYFANLNYPNVAFLGFGVLNLYNPQLLPNSIEELSP